MKPSCKNCSKYKGDCGHHFKDNDGHINYNVPSESMYDRWGGGNPKCWSPNEDYIQKRKEARLKYLVENYTSSELLEAATYINQTKMEYIRRNEESEFNKIEDAKEESLPYGVTFE